VRRWRISSGIVCFCRRDANGVRSSAPNYSLGEKIRHLIRKAGRQEKISEFNILPAFLPSLFKN
jgi:hypothetical protein